MTRGDQMGYRIEYDPKEHTSGKAGVFVRRIQILTAAFFLLFVLLVRQAWLEGTEILRNTLLPGELSFTRTAFQTMLGDIRQGTSVQEALTVFCQQIIDHG